MRMTTLFAYPCPRPYPTPSTPATFSLQFSFDDVSVKADFAGPNLLITLPSVRMSEFTVTMEIGDSMEKELEPVTLIETPKHLIGATKVAMVGYVPVVWSVYFRLLVRAKGSFETATKAYIKLSMPQLRILDALEIGFEYKDKNFQPVVGGLRNVADKFKQNLEAALAGGNGILTCNRDCCDCDGLGVGCDLGSERERL